MLLLTSEKHQCHIGTIFQELVDSGKDGVGKTVEMQISVFQCEPATKTEREENMVNTDVFLIQVTVEVLMDFNGLFDKTG